MSIYTEALNASFELENTELLNESMWDLVAPIVGDIEEPIEENLQEDLVDDLEKEAKELNKKDADNIEESLKESIEKYGLTPERAIDMYEHLLESNVPKDQARLQVLSAERGIKEHLKEEASLTRKERLDKEKKNRIKRYAEEFRIAENFTLDEELNDDKLKYHKMALERHAVRHGIPVAKLKEALIKGIN